MGDEGRHCARERAREPPRHEAVGAGPDKPLPTLRDPGVGRAGGDVARAAPAIALAERIAHAAGIGGRHAHDRLPVVPRPAVVGTEAAGVDHLRKAFRRAQRAVIGIVGPADRVHALAAAAGRRGLGLRHVAADHDQAARVVEIDPVIAPVRDGAIGDDVGVAGIGRGDEAPQPPGRAVEDRDPVGFGRAEFDRDDDRGVLVARQILAVEDAGTGRVVGAAERDPAQDRVRPGDRDHAARLLRQGSAPAGGEGQNLGACRRRRVEDHRSARQPHVAPPLAVDIGEDFGIGANLGARRETEGPPVRHRLHIGQVVAPARPEAQDRRGALAPGFQAGALGHRVAVALAGPPARAVDRVVAAPPQHQPSSRLRLKPGQGLVDIGEQAGRSRRPGIVVERALRIAQRGGARINGVPIAGHLNLAARHPDLRAQGHRAGDRVPPERLVDMAGEGADRASGMAAAVFVRGEAGELVVLGRVFREPPDAEGAAHEDLGRQPDPRRRGGEIRGVQLEMHALPRDGGRA